MFRGSENLRGRMIFYILFGATLVLFILLHAVVFPRVFFHAGGEIKSRDRGVRDINEVDGGRTIIYEPEYKYRAYVKHYALSQRDGEKIFTCETDKNLRYIDYDIRMFNGKGKVFKVLNVKEVIKEEGITRPVTVDKDTAYVSLSVNKADGTVFTEKKSPYKVSSRMLALYFLFCSIVDIISVFVCKICIAEIFGGVFHESFVYSFAGNLITGVLCAAIIAVNVIVTLIVLKVISTVKVGKE